MNPNCPDCPLDDASHDRIAVAARHDAPDKTRRRELITPALKRAEQRHGRPGRVFTLPRIMAAAAVLLALTLWWKHTDGDVSEPTTHADAARWQLLGVVGPVRVAVEAAVYAAPGGGDKFTVRIRVTNVGDRPLGLDLAECVFPAAVGVARARRLPVHPNGIRAGAPVLSPAAERALVDAFDSLTPLAPGESLEYFPKKSPNTRARLDQQRGTHVHIFFAGRLLATDGDVVYLPSCSSDGGQLGNWLRLPRPWTWKKLPADALLIR